MLGDHQVPPTCPNIAEESKNHDTSTIVCRKSVKIIFPLRCSHFIFLDETAVCRHHNVHDCHFENHDGWGVGVSGQQDNICDRPQDDHLHRPQQDAPRHPGHPIETHESKFRLLINVIAGADLPGRGDGGGRWDRGWLRHSGEKICPKYVLIFSTLPMQISAMLSLSLTP